MRKNLVEHTLHANRHVWVVVGEVENCPECLVYASVLHTFLQF